MKTTFAAGGGFGGVLVAAAMAGAPALVLLGVVLIALIAVGCWVITNPARTRNTVALITAARTRPDTPARAPQPRRARQPGIRTQPTDPNGDARA